MLAFGAFLEVIFCQPPCYALSKMTYLTTDRFFLLECILHQDSVDLFAAFFRGIRFSFPGSHTLSQVFWFKKKVSSQKQDHNMFIMLAEDEKNI